MAGSRSPLRGGKFIGSYLHQLDEKGRLSLPASYRRDTEQRFILLQPYEGPSLALYPELEWAAVEERLQDMLRDPAGRMWVLKIMATAVEVAPDAQGRILIPQGLREAAKLGSQALLVGAINKVEIWNPQAFEEATRVEEGRFQAYAASVFR